MILQLLTHLTHVTHIHLVPWGLGDKQLEVEFLFNLFLLVLLVLLLFF